MALSEAEGVGWLEALEPGLAVRVAERDWEERAEEAAAPELLRWAEVGAAPVERKPEGATEAEEGRPGAATPLGKEL